MSRLPHWFYRDLFLTDPPKVGVDVMSLQIALRMDPRLRRGVFDEATAICVDAFRAEHNLPPGAFDDTCARLLEEHR